MTDPSHTLQSTIERIRPGSVILSTRPLSNANAQKMTAVELQLPSGKRETLVCRRHTPERIAHEARLLRLLQMTDIPVAEVHQTTGDYMIQSFLPGESRFSPADVSACVSTMAQTLAQIHQTDLPPDALAFLPRMRDICQQRIDNRPATLQASMGEPQIRQTLKHNWQTLTHNAPVLLHGDFWPGNLLWQHEQISGVVDWEDAAFGDPLADLGNSRREVLWFFGKEAMQQFTEAYQAQMPPLNYRNLPYWDLCMALKPVGQVSSWCLDDDAKDRFRTRQRWLVNQACDALKTHTVD